MPIGDRNLPQIGDNQDVMVELLRIIAMNTGGMHGDITIGGDEITIEGSTDENGDPIYATTGPNGVLLDDDEWHDFPLGFTARVINFRFDQPIDVAFRSPYDRPNSIIRLGIDESPFTIGGDNRGIRTSVAWMRRGPPADPEDDDPLDPIAHIIAWR